MALANKQSVAAGCRRTAPAAPRLSAGARPAGLGAAHMQQRRPAGRLVVVAAAEPEVKEVSLGKAAQEAAAPAPGDNWIPVCRPEDLPKGVRKEFDVNGLQVLMFWYRNQPYAIEARSPAEGAYAEGFIKAKFTQDYAIECPSTGSLFSLKDGSIMSWYPNNPVLRALTPSNTCRPLEIYPVKFTDSAVCVDVSNARLGARASADRGGAGSSAEDNNVFTVQPTVYFEGMDPRFESASVYGSAGGTGEKLNPGVVSVGILAVGIIGVAGTATALFYESVVGLVAFWVALGGAAAFFGFQYVNKLVPNEPKQ